MKKWEYHVHMFNQAVGGLTQVLVDYGADGWELVAVVPHAPHLQLVFKRELSDV